MADEIADSRPERLMSDIAQWADEQSRQHLQVLVNGVATLSGFEQAAISLRRSAGFFEVVAGAGVPDAFVGTRTPSADIEAELAKADVWGAWRFLPHHRMNRELIEASLVNDVAPLDRPDAWHPLDMLAAPLRDHVGRLSGLFYIDGPRNGLRPSAEQLVVLNDYSAVARTLVLLAIERHDLAVQLRLADEARRIVRGALGQPTLEQVLDACRPDLVHCFDAEGMWLTAFDADGDRATTSYTLGEDVEIPFSDIHDVVIRLARRYWKDQYVASFSPLDTAHPGLPPHDAEQLLQFLDRTAIGSVLFVPLGAGHQCLGFLVLTRANAAQHWTTTERDAALDIGRDLGSAVATARQLERERGIAERLRLLDAHRLEMVNTLGHELRTPLFSMTGNLELLDPATMSDDDRRAVAAATRGADRMRAIIEDLLTMAQVADPMRKFVAEPVDLGQVLREVEEEGGPAADARSQSFRITAPDGPAMVSGRDDELHRMLANVVSNAMKYSDEGGVIDLELVRTDEMVRVSVADEGIGIAPHDLDHLFREFFRSTNPDALVRPGTGLGLSIVDRIARRHSGRVEVSSELGRGTKVSITLPAAADS